MISVDLGEILKDRLPFSTDSQTIEALTVNLFDYLFLFWNRNFGQMRLIIGPSGVKSLNHYIGRRIKFFPCGNHFVSIFMVVCIGFLTRAILLSDQKTFQITSDKILNSIMAGASMMRLLIF